MSGATRTAPGALHELARLTWTEVRGAIGERAIAVLPIGTIEPHGPHLALDADVTIAEAMARRAGARLAAAGATALVVPTVPFGLTNYADSFPGWISLKPATLWALLEDLVASLEQNGVLRVAFCNAHLEPAHVRVLRGVAGDHAAPPAKCRAQVVFPDHTRRRWAATLGEEFAGGDCHAGRYETSIVMAEDPAGVREARRKALPPVSIGLIAAMQRGVRGFAAAGAREAYCGDPASASAGEGEELVDRLATMVETTCRETWPEAFGAEPGAS